METLFKKLLEKKVCDPQGIAYCLAELAKNSDFKSVMDICINGIPSWSVNPDIVRKFIYNNYQYKNIIIEDIRYNYVQNLVEVKYSYEDIRWCKTENATQWHSGNSEETEEYKFKKTFVRSSYYNINYDDYCSKAEGLSVLKIDDETPVEG